MRRGGLVVGLSDYSEACGKILSIHSVASDARYTPAHRT